MAGESPDRSKQRESSEETTSGNGGTVPGKRDPRLTVSREAESSESRGNSEGRGNVDTATRVLSARDGAPADGGDESGRLREAVATWVRSAEAERDADGPEDASGGQDGSGAEPESGRAETADEDASGRTADAAEPEDGAADTGVDATDASRGREDSVNAGSAGSETPTATAGASRAEDGPEDAAQAVSEAGRDVDAPETAAPAGDATRGRDEDAAQAVSEAGTDVDAPKPAADASRDQDGPEEARKDASGSGADANADAPETAAPAGSATPGRDEDGDAAQDGPDADAEEDGSSEAAGTAEASAPAGAAPGEEDPGTGSPSGGGDGKPAAEPVPGAREAAGDTSAEDGDDRHDEDGPGAADDAPGAAGAKDGDEERDGRPKAGGPVDQPTAVFRTGRPSAPAVDQPTTMLKLGAAGREAEAEAERTSKFVALKRDEDLGVRKPPAEPTAPAAPTASLPQVGPERTTQQPLPPKPPLDLLAELTNTPPPPQTPLRTAVRRVKIWTPLVLLLVIVFAVVQNMRPLPAPTLELTAEDGYTFEGAKPDIPWPAEGQAALDVDGIGTFGSSGEQKPVPIASVAKVMTAYLVLRDHPLKSGAEGPMLKIDELAEKQSDAGQESTVNVTAGDEISQREAVEAILIASANNVARLLARWDAGSEEAFVEKMNAAAKDLGMTDTTYTDPSGLNDTTVSTAVDQVKLARAAMEQPAFREVAAMMSYDDYKGVNHPNWNQLVGHNDVVGIKTGTTTSALGNLVFAAKKDVDGETHRIIGAVVRQPAGGKDNTILSAALTSGDELIRAAQDVLESATILKKGDVVGYVDDGLGGRTPVAVTEDVKAVGWAGLSVKLTFAAEELPHTAKAGTKVGALTVGDGTSGAVEVPVALQEDLVEPAFADRLTRLT
ncbi:D-alanyl-D-alanine carboxypeptidase [Streptomyces caelestis]|uniref:D-alanyl-D-alanine carboxypeptidase n=1 Tax=Streptomyces caelestis TaxID=36816 RepID=UPI0036534B70